LLRKQAASETQRVKQQGAANDVQVWRLQVVAADMHARHTLLPWGAKEARVATCGP